MVFFHCTLSIHHVGHISFWGYCPAVLAVVPHMPHSPAWSVVSRVAAWWSAEAEDHGVHSFTGRRWGRRDLSPGAGGGLDAERALESAGSCVRVQDAAIRPAWGLGWQLDTERRCSRGGGVQELGYSLQQHVAAALQ